MFGKGLIKILGLALSGAIALAAGAQILSSVVSVVLAFRFGNYLPLAIVVSLTISIPLIGNRVPEKSQARNILRIMAYTITGYLAVIAFVLALPFGLVASIIAASTVGVLSSILNDQKVFWEAVRQSLVSPARFNGIANRALPIGKGTSLKLGCSHHIAILESGARENLLHLMKERPLLPISFTHFEDCDALFIAYEAEPKRHEQILRLLKESNIGIRTASPLLAEAVQLIPLLDSRNGVKFENYGLVRDDKTINSLLEKAPSRFTIFPTPHGLSALVLDMDAPGLNVERLANGHETEVILHRNYKILEGVESAIESTA